MKLRYWHYQSNFGDELNPWLWHRLFPKPIEQYFDDETLFLGIGSILGQNVPKQAKKLVFSSGFAYGSVPKIDDRWKFFCVRGPLTANMLELPSNLAICDGAILLKRFYEPAQTPLHNITFMPHLQTSKQEPSWENICHSLSITFLDPTTPVEEAIDTIRNSRVVVTESLHGAIVADALRVPWISVRTRSHINEFKWNDWTQSLGMEHSFEWLPPVEYTKGPFVAIQKKLYPARALLCGYRLQQIARSGRKRLSKDSVCQEAYGRISEKFQELLAFAD